jgi:hypothetical protein
MKKQTRSILQELNSMVQNKDRAHVFESRAESIIQSSINLINELYEHYDENVADDLRNRFVNSIKGQDVKKFVRGINRTKDQ